MTLYRPKPGTPFEAFQVGSLEKKPPWLEAAFICGLVKEWGHGQRDGPFLSVETSRATIENGDYLVWDSAKKSISPVMRDLFEARYEAVEG